MRSSGLLLGSVLLTAFIAASLVGALADFAGQVLPQAAHSRLARSPGMSVVVIGLLDAGAARADTRAIRESAGKALMGVPSQLDEAVWSSPLTLTAPDGGTQGAEVAAPARVRANAALAAGTWPGPPRTGEPVPAALPAALARQLRIAPGALLALRDDDTRARLRLRVTGLYRQRDPASRYWGIDQIWTCGASIQHCPARHGPIVVDPAAFGRAGLTVAQASWAVLPDTARIGTGQLTGLATRIEQAGSHLQRPALGGLVATSGMPAVLLSTAGDLVVARSLLVIAALELLLPAAAALALAARLLASHRADEAALLGARGATRWQLALPALAEAVLIGTTAAVAGALAGRGLAGLLASSGLLRGEGLRPPRSVQAAWLPELGVLLLCVLILVWPALRPPTPGAARARRGRQAARTTAVVAGADLLLLALATIAVLELRAYSASAHPAAGGTGIDPVLAIAPALALAGISLIPVRALPVLARLLDRMSAARRRLGAALASWEISRRPARQAGPVLLAVFMVAASTLALAQYQSWRRSARDQGAFMAGADVRADLPAPVPAGQVTALTRAPGVTAAMPVSSVLLPGTGGEILALSAQQAPATVLLRPDLSQLPATALWRRITPPRPRPGWAVPGRPARLEILASLAPGPRASYLGSVSATLSVQDASGAVYSMPAGTLPTDGRPHGLIAVLSSTRQADYPLRLLGVSLTYTLPPFPAPRQATATLTIRGLAVSSFAAGAFGVPFARGRNLGAWRPAASSPALDELPATNARVGSPAAGIQPAVSAWRGTASGLQVLAFRPGSAPSAAATNHDGAPAGPVTLTGMVTITAPVSATVVPAIATSAFLRDGHIGVGAVLPVSLGSASVPVKVVAQVSHFPTVTGAGGAVIVDQAAVQDVLASRRDPPLPVTSWWLRTAVGAARPALPAGSAVTTPARESAALVGDPLSAAPQQALLAVAITVALLAAVGFSVGVAASLRARRTQSALLAALGVARPAQARLLCLEQLMLSLPAAATGLLAGAGLARLIVPAITLTPAGGAPVPPVLVEFPLGWAVVLALAVAAVPALITAATVVRQPDPAARLRGAEAL